jgi:branched-chain amino acid transport system substrate-binding protein
MTPSKSRSPAWALIAAACALGLSLAAGCTAETKATSDATGADTTVTDPDTTTATTEDTSSDADGTSSGCTKHSDCASQGADFVCGKGGACVQANTANCTLTPPNGGVDDKTVLIGAVSPKSFENGILLYIENAILMAQGEVNSARLPGERRIGVISCNNQIENEDPNAKPWLANADHLANKVGVPVILGPAFSGIFIETYQEVTKAAGVVTLSMSATSPAITDLDIGEAELTWRVVPSDVAQAAAMAKLISVRNPSKAIIFVKDDAYGNGLFAAFQSQFSSQITSGNFKVVRYEPATNEDGLRSITNSNFDIEAETIVLLGTDEVGTILKTYEDRTITYNETNTPIAPAYLLSEGGKESALGKVKEVATASAAAGLDLITRLEGTQPDTRNPRISIYNNFAAGYFSKYNEQPGVFSSTAYDAMYVVFYAMCTASETAPITPTDIISGLRKLGSGTRVEPGSGAIPSARTTLRSGGSIDYDGASGEITFDAKGDVAGSAFTRWTIQNFQDKTPPDLRFLEDQGTYSVVSDSWTLP